jgi:hypothetical protein
MSLMDNLKLKTYHRTQNTAPQRLENDDFGSHRPHLRNYL